MPKRHWLPFFGLVHLGVTFAAAVFGRAGRSNQGGVDHGASLEHEALHAALVVDDLQDART